MNQTQSPPNLTREQFIEESTSLATEFLSISRDRKLSIGVILQAAMEVHRYAARQLPQEAQSNISLGIAGYAGELLQGLPAINPTQSTTKH